MQAENNNAVQIPTRVANKILYSSFYEVQTLTLNILSFSQNGTPLVHLQQKNCTILYLNKKIKTMDYHELSVN